MGNAAVQDTPVALGLQTLETVSKTTGWAFKGQRILQAAIDSAINDFGMGSEPGHRLLFSGCSAGSRGAMVNIDNVAAQVAASTAEPVEVRGFFDSPMWVDVQPFQRDIVSLENETIAISLLVNATAVMDQACVANFTTVISAGLYDLSQTWKCLYGQYRMPFVRTPYLISGACLACLPSKPRPNSPFEASQFDKFQLPYNEGGNPPWNGSALAYADTFQLVVRGVMSALPTPAQPYSAVFSSACLRHCVSQLADFWDVRIGTQSLKSWLSLWYFGVEDSGSQTSEIDSAGVKAGLPFGTSPRLIEPCTGFGCGQCTNRTLRPGYPSAATNFYSTPQPASASALSLPHISKHDSSTGLKIVAIILLVILALVVCATVIAATSSSDDAKPAAGGLKKTVAKVGSGPVRVASAAVAKGVGGIAQWAGKGGVGGGAKTAAAGGSAKADVGGVQLGEREPLLGPKPVRGGVKSAQAVTDAL